MNNINVKELKDQLDTLSANLGILKVKAKAIITEIDEGRFLSIESISSFSDDLTRYQEDYMKFCHDGSSLSLNTCVAIEKAKAAINEYEKSVQQESHRAVILDYFQLNSADGDDRARLTESKQKLMQICRDDENINEALNAYTLVIQNVKNNIQVLDDEVFEIIEDQIHKRIARALESGRLYIDKSLDISEYLDSSCDILNPVKQDETEKKNQEQLPVNEETVDQSTEHNEENVLVTTQDKDDTTEKNQAIDIDEDPGSAYSGYLTNASYQYTDEPASSLSVSKFKSEIKLHPLIPGCMVAISLLKFVDPSSETDNKRCPGLKDTIHYLVKEKYVAVAHTYIYGYSKSYYVLTSKGNACFERSETKKILEDASTASPNFMRYPTKHFSPAFAAQSLLIKNYLDQHKEFFPISLTQYNRKTEFAYCIVKDDDRKTAFSIVAAIFDRNSSDMADFQNAIFTLADYQVIILVKSMKDAEILKKRYNLIPQNGKKISYDILEIIEEPKTDTGKNEPGEDERTEAKNEITWESFGISDPADLIYNDTGIKVEVIEDKKAAKPFSVKEFKNDMRRLSNTEKAIDILRAIRFSLFITPQIISCTSKDMLYNYSPYIEKLFQLGYLKKVYSGDDEPFYCLSNKGGKILTSKEGASFIGMKPNNRYENTKSDPVSEKSYISRKIYLKTMLLAKQIDENCPFDGISVTASELLFFVSYSHDDNKNITFLSVISDNPEDFSFEKIEVSEILNKTDIFVVIGYNAAQAKALGRLFYSKYDSLLDGITLKLYDFEKNEFHDYPSSDIDIDELLLSDSAAIPDEVQQPATTEAQATTEPSESLYESQEEAPFDAEPASNPSSEGIVHSGTKPDNDFRVHTNELIDSMITDDKIYCATAYLAAVSANHPEYKPLYSQLAFAVNDPLYECSYTSQKIFDIYFHDDTAPSDYYVISAVLRNYFLDHYRYDYNMQSLYDAVKESSAFQISSKLKSVVRSIMEFKRDNNHGLDYYADYRIVDGSSYETNLKEICNEAHLLYTSQVEGITKENAKNKRVLETKKLIFARDRDIATMLSYVANNELENLELIRATVGDMFIKDGAEVDYENLDPEKIDQFIDDAWDAAQESLTFKRNNIKLVSGLRQNLISKVKEALSILCRYVELGQSNINKQADKGYISYKKLRSELLENINTCLTDYQRSLGVNKPDSSGKKTVIYTLNEIKDKITGNYKEERRKYFYLPFLQSTHILLDDRYMPILDDIESLEEMTAVARIERHYRSSLLDYPARLTSITNGQDDYGSARLILQYLIHHPSDELNINEIEVKVREGVHYPREGIKNTKKEFEEFLELAQFYGQIDNSVDNKKEIILQIVDHWYEITLETDNYGFFKAIVEAFKNKVRQDATIRSNDLQKNLEAYKQSHEGWEKDSTVKETIKKIEDRISFQNYTSAEDLLNRLQANDIDPDIPSIENDYLAEFLREYKDLTRDAGTSRSPIPLNLTANTKEAKGGKMLLENWPKGTGASIKKIGDLLTALGFNIANISQKDTINNRIDNFFVKLAKPSNGRKNNYKHPISIFGSEAEDIEFRVACVYGTRTPEGLIDIFKEIGNAKNTLVLLDHTMNLPDRRELARRAKKDYTGRSFIVIDRVVITYLAKHYSQTATNRMLMAITVPFAYYQPYISDSSKVMPPEIFMGRKAELEKIESSSGVNIVYGGRQLGKSALLRMAQKDINSDENNDRAVLIDIKGKNYIEAARKVAEELYDQDVLDRELPLEEASDWNIIGRELKNILRNGNKRGRIPYLLLLLDEADTFIESCEEINYAPFDALKDVQSVGPGRFKFVVAGLRNVVRLKKNVALGNNSVLTHLSYLTVTPFKTAEARELLEIPLSYLGFRFPDDSKTDMLISNIFGTTNYFPGLLQMYCAKLIEAMKKDYAGYDQSDTPPYFIREEHIKKVLADKSLGQQIREKFMITLKVDEDDYYYQLALLAAFHYHNQQSQNGCSPKDIHDIAQDYGLSKIADLSVDEIEALMEEMRELNVFQLVGNGNYRFVRHSFCGMMGSAQEIDDKMLEYAV